MSFTSLSELLIKIFGEKLYKQSVKFPNNKINIISIKVEPIKIRTIILDNDREYHLIINQKKAEIFHDCPNFLIHSSREDKICIHFLKLLILIKKELAIKIIEEFEKYSLTSEDFGSKKKSKNYLLLANACFETNNYVEGLSYLSKAIINQSECKVIVEKFLRVAIDRNLFIEFFEFLKSCHENELDQYIIEFNDDIEKGFKKFLNTVSDYSFFSILRINKSLNKIFKFKDISFIVSLIDKFNKMVNSSNFNERYFSIYFIKTNIELSKELNRAFCDIISGNQLDKLKEELLIYFFTEIDNFCLIDKLKLLKKQFDVLDIPKDKYHDIYKKYKNEIKELEKKVYLKKFSFLNLLMEKYNIKRTKGDFRKKRNTYFINHDQENLENPVYNYILSRIGFFGINETTIKSSEIGINYLIIKELFLDDLSTLPDVFYYKKQFWGETCDFKINPLNGFSLMSENMRYNYEIDQKYSNINDLMIIEWDLANKPIQGCLVNAYGSQIIIPDPNNPLFDDLKPFDTCYCIRTPVKIEGNNVKTINVLTKCSFKDAIKSISKGMTFIEGFYPFSLIRAVLDKEISPFEANEIVVNNPNKIFIPNYNKFVETFRNFLFKFIHKEKDYIFEEMKNNPGKKINQILILMNLLNELSGLNLPFLEITEKLFNQNINLNEFKLKFLSEIHSCIKKILNKREMGSTIIFNLKKLRNTPFFKYSNQILEIRKSEFESIKVYKFKDIHNVSELQKTYYGKQFLKILNVGLNPTVKPDVFKKISDFATKLKLNLNVIKSEFT